MRSTPKFVVTCSPASCYATASYVFKLHTTLENFDVLVRFHIFTTVVSQLNTTYHFQRLTKAHFVCVTLTVPEAPFYLLYNWNIFEHLHPGRHTTDGSRYVLVYRHLLTPSTKIYN
jgi:hypothetical protein